MKGVKGGMVVYTCVGAHMCTCVHVEGQKD